VACGLVWLKAAEVVSRARDQQADGTKRYHVYLFIQSFFVSISAQVLCWCLILAMSWP
jgi:hypothetical protein